jgi:uncharacterized Rmd1/YagE family protein
MSQPITDPDLATWRRFSARAVLLARRIDLRAIDSPSSFATAPLAVPAGERGIAVLFRYGAAVMFQVQPVEEAAFLKSLAAVLEERLGEVEREETAVDVDPTREEERVGPSGSIQLRALSLERLLIVADVLAKSVVLAYDESRVARVFDRIEPVAEGLQRWHGGRLPARQLLGHIGDVLITQHRMVGRVEVTEKPDLLWDRPELERLYLRLEEEYELAERDRALSRKLDLIAQTASTALGLVQARRSLRVEWYIVILIIIEIFLTLYQMWQGGGH